MKRQQQFVPAVLPGVAANSVQVSAPRKALDDVTVQIAQNAAGGVGVAGLAALASWQLSGGDWQTVAVAALVAGFAVFCAALAIRSFADEGAILVRVVRKEIELRTMLDDAESEWADRLDEAEAALADALAEIAELQAQAKSLRSERDMAQAELQNLRHQVATERSSTYRSKVGVYEKPRRDAKTLAQMAIEAGVWPARDEMLRRLDWTRERWEAAFVLLRDCGIVRQSGTKGNHVRLMVADLDRAFAMIDEATGVIVADEA